MLDERSRSRQRLSPSLFFAQASRPFGEGGIDGGYVVNEASLGTARGRGAAAVAAVAAFLGGCVPTEGGVDPAAASHTHADHAHASISEHADHAHDAIPRGGGAMLTLIDIDGIDHGTLAAPARGRFTSLFFTRTDCPIANQYAPQIKRICADYAAAGVECLLVYVDGHLAAEDVRRHAADFDYALPAILDREHSLVAYAGATITPEVAVLAPGAALEYRGRIDNLYVELGRPRREASERDLRNALDDLVAGRVVRRPRTQATGCYIE
jgi:hypothetical protein